MRNLHVDHRVSSDLHWTCVVPCSQPLEATSLRLADVALEAGFSVREDIGGLYTFKQDSGSPAELPQVYLLPMLVRTFFVNANARLCPTLTDF